MRASMTQTFRATATLPQDLYEKALYFSDPKMKKTELFREAVKVFIQVQAAKRLAALGGTAPDMANIYRRKSVEV